jgi:signal peptide peptidase SppA
MPKQHISDNAIWAGDEVSLMRHIQRLAMNAERMQAGIYPDMSGDGEPKPYLLDIQGNVAVITIHGPTSNESSYWDSYDKAATYPAIREALLAAANDDQVDNIILDINSGGGAVSGVADVASLVRQVNDNYKTVTAFTDGNMMSAAYWIGSSADKVYASQIAGTGSIGVIATHMDLSKMMEQQGIKPTVMRAGKYKALANPMEPLTEAAKQQMQDGLDAVYGTFVQHVADMRGVDYKTADDTMAQGRVFYGDAGVKAGLVDGITTFDGLMSKLPVDVSQSVSHNPLNITQGNTMKKALSPQSLAALASGLALADPAATAAADAAAVAAAAAAAAGGAPAAGTTPPAAGATGEATPATGTVAETGTPALAAGTPAGGVPATPAADLTVYLQSQIKERDAALLAANVELASMKQRTVEFETTMKPLMAIAAKSANNMRIALGGSALDMSGMSASQVCADHDAVATQFTTKFVAGGIAAVDASESKPNAKSVEPDGLTRARLAASATQTANRK